MTYNYDDDDNNNNDNNNNNNNNNNCLNVCIELLKVFLSLL